MIAEQMLEGSSLYPAIDPEMLVTTGRIVADKLDIGPDFTDAYWLGWVNFDNLPVDYRLSSFTINGDTVTLADVTEQKNYDIGYTVGNANKPAYKAGVIRYDEENTHWVAWDHQESDVEAHSTWMRLCNQVDINRQGLTRIVPIFAINPMNSQNVSTAYTMAFCVVDAPTFLKDDTWTAVATIVNLRGNSGITGEVTFSASDIDGQVHTGVLGGVNCEYFCCGFQIENSNWTMYNPQTDKYEFTTIQSTLRPFFALEANGFDGKYVVNAASAPFNDGFSLYYGAGYTYNQRYGFLWEYNQNPYVYQTKPFNTTEGLMAGNFVGSFSAAAVRERFSSSNVYGFYGVDGANFILQSTGIYEFVMIRRLYSIDEIRKTMSLYPRIINPDFPDYVNYANLDTPSINDPIYAHVTEDNEFITDTVSGGLDCLTKLKTWQRIGVKIAPEFSPYDTADKPEYTPGDKPSPVETEGKFSGDPTLGQVTRTAPAGGTIYYALNATELVNFKKCLWSQTKNFYDAIQIAGKQNTSIFEYITCLKYFPMNIDWKGDEVAHPVLMGTGAVFKKQNSDDNFELSSINGPQKAFSRAATWKLSDSGYNWRGNFLDYAPYTKITMFLPFVGTVELSPEQIASHTNIDKAIIYLSAAVDAPSGSITYVVYNQNNVVLAEKTGKIAIDLPLSGNDNAAQAQAILEAQFRMGKQILGNSVGVASSVAGNAMNGNLIGALTGAGTSTFNNIISTVETYIQNSLAHKQVPVEIGSFGGVLSNIGISQIPYITVYRQKVANPENYGHTTGFLVEGTYLISGLEGFTKCNNVDVSGISQATDKEKAQIKQILESGFYA